MNTVLKGDIFEIKVFKKIKERLEKGELGFIPESCEIFHKKSYYSKDRMKDITFDISIETKFPDATKFSFLTLIECKSYSHSVPVNDIEEFYTKVNQVADLNGKGIFVTDSVFQEGAFNFANSKGITLIQLKNDDYNYILHRTNIGNNTLVDIHSQINDLIFKIFEEKAEGLLFLSKKQIEEIATNFLNEIDNQIISNCKPTPIKLIEECIYDCSQIRTVKDRQISSDNDKILGYFNPKEREIAINNTIVDNPCFPFVFTHEVGHFKLHNSLKVNQKSNHIYRDPEMNFLKDRRELINDKHWIEWQANQFAASLLMPEDSIWILLLSIQQKSGIRNKGTIFVDNQRDNQQNFLLTISELANYFNVAKINVEYRLSELGVIKYGNNTPKHWTKFL